MFVSAKKASVNEAYSKQEKPIGNSNNYLPQLDGLRGIALLMVFFYHLPRMPELANFTWLSNGYNFIVSSGWLGVELFFVLSGFLITTLLLREKRIYNSISIKLFYIRRALRIWPVYYPFLIAASFVFLPIFSHNLSLQYYGEYLLKQFIPLFFFVGNFSFIIDQNSISNVSSALIGPSIWLNAALIPFWSLCVEEQFYAFWPIVVNKIKGPNNLIKLVIATICASFVLRAVFWFLSTCCFSGQAHILYYMNTFSHLDPLMIGALLGIFYVYFPEVIKQISQKSLIPAIIFLTALNLYWAPNISSNAWTTVPVFFTSAVLFAAFIILSLNSSWLKTLLVQEPLRSIGIISFTMYVFHDVVLKLTSFALLDQMHLQLNTSTWVALVSISLGITYVIAYFSWITIESKLKTLRHKYSR